jgi:hypothetical protein
VKKKWCLYFFVKGLRCHTFWIKPKSKPFFQFIFLTLETLKDSCLVAPYNCAEGLTLSFWLQFKSGGIIIRTGKAGFHVYVEDGKFFITYQGVDRSWTIERGCISMDVFLVTATWSAAGGLSYYENGEFVVSTQISDSSSISGNFDDVITVGYEETSSGKRFSSLTIDDLMIWNRALSSENVRAIHSYGKLW